LAYAFGSVHLRAGYTGTVTVQDNTSAVTFELRTGAIAQAAANDGTNDFTVTGTMTFTGGTFNSTTNSGHLSLGGTSLSTIGGAGGTTVTVGSRLSVNGNATLAYTNATIAFANGSYFDSLGGSTVVPSILSGDSVFTNIGATNNPHLIQGDFTLKSNSQKAFKVQLGGHLKIVKSLEIAGNCDPAFPGSASLWMRDTFSRITVTNNTELKAISGFGMNCGAFETNDVGLTISNHTVTLQGNMSVTGGIIDLSQDANGLHLGALEVFGNVTFTGGEYRARFVGTATSLECNLWKVNGTFTTAAGANITATISSGALPAADPLLPRYWDIITATGKIPAGDPLPTLAAPAGVTGEIRSMREKYSLKY